MEWVRLCFAQCSLHQCFQGKYFEVFNIYNPHDLKLLSRLRLGLSHLRGHKFKHNFSDCLNEICMCGKDMEFSNHFLLPYSLFLKERQVLMNETRDIDSSFIDQNENFLCYTLLFGKQNMNDHENAHVLNATIEYILVTERLYLNKSKPLQLITTIIINDSILFELSTTFLFSFIYSVVS